VPTSKLLFYVILKFIIYNIDGNSGGTEVSFARREIITWWGPNGDNRYIY